MSDYRALVPVAPPPPPPRATATLFPLALEVDGVDVIATSARRIYVIRGLLAAVLLPMLFALLGVLIAVGLAEDGASADEALTVGWSVLSGLSFVFGVGLIVLSKRLSRRRAVRFDRARSVVHAGTTQLPFEGLELRVRRLEGLSGWTTLEACHGGRVVTVHDRLQPMHASDVTTHVAYLADLVGNAPVQVAADAAIGPRSRLIPDNTAAMLCYLPLQGINVIASLYYLFAARDRPRVRFAAKQSLTQLALTVVALFAIGVGLGLPLALVMDGERELTPIAIVLLVLLVISLTVVGIGNLVALIVACVRAQAGRVWVMPWLRRIVGRWVPSE